MNNTKKLHPGSKFPSIKVKDLDGKNIALEKPKNSNHLQLVIIYRGRHCPLCTKYLNQLEAYKERLLKNNVEMVAVSADSKEQMEEHLLRLDVSFPIYHSLTEEQMRKLGLYISVPRSEKETDHNFAEPGLFLINKDGDLHVVDISNNPFVRPDLESLVSGLEWIFNPSNNYPIRGTANY